MRRHIVCLCGSLALAGCSLTQIDGDLTVQRRPDLTVALPYLEPGAPAGGLTRVRHDEQPEKLPPPKSEENKDDKDAPPKARPDEADGKKSGSETHADENPLRSGGQLTLAQAIQTTLQNDPKLRGAAELIVQAQADLVTAGTKPNPNLTVLPSFIPLFRPITPNTQGGPTQLEVDFTYPVDWCLFGKMAADVAAARVGIDVSEFDFADTLRMRVEEVVIAYFDMLEAQALVKLARQDLETLRRTERTLERAVKAGGKAQVDLNRIRLDRVRSEQTLREATSALNQARARLRALFGRKDALTEFDVEGSLEGELSAGEVSSDALYAAAEASRPDVRSARAQLAKAQADVVAEDRKAYPELNVRANYYRQFQRTSIHFPDMDTWGAGFDSTLPCFNRNQGARIKARSRVAQETQELERTLVDLRAEIERLVLEYRLAAANARAVTSDQLKLAADIRDAITKSYQAGGRSLLELLDAQRNYRDVLRSQVTTRASFYRAAYRLQNATGVKIQR
jgi:cobalt-zinc-cadmium efflux system outer membrane protein